MTGGRVLALALAATTALGGCTTLGGNVKGSFACSAPDGICAPSSTIDDRALALISGEEGDRMITPAGPYPAQRSEGRGFQTAAAAPARTRERVLRIVFPAQIDAAGRLHEQTAVHAVVEQGDWQQALAGEAVATSAQQVASATGSDTLLAALERSDPPVADIAAIDPDMPTDAAIQAARARSAVDPVGDIKDQVARRLSARPRRRGNQSVVRAIPAEPAQTAKVAPTTLATPLSSASASRPIASAMMSTSTTSAPTVPARATAAGKAAIAAVAANTSIRNSLASAEPEARAAAKSASPVPVLRASSFPGVDQ